MAITDKKTGVWGLDQTFNKINQGSIWGYAGALAERTQLYVWGGNPDGQLGQNNQGGWSEYLTAQSSPIQIPGDWAQIASGGTTTGGVKTDGTLWIWGGNNYGEAGQNNATYGYSSPVQIPGTSWSSLFVDRQHSWAIRTDGTFWAWGRNEYGQLGQNNTTAYSSPTQIPGDWSKMESSNYNTVGLKSNGTLWAWGSNQYGQLAQNTSGEGGSSSLRYSSPVQIPGTSWSDCAAFYYGAAAIRTDGTLWTWGFNGNGICGVNNAAPIMYSSPVQVPGTNWSKLGNNYHNLFGIKTDGTLWAWGSDSYGALGQLTRNQRRSSPVQIPGTTWRHIDGNGPSTMRATKTDGTLWAWGVNEAGENGQNDRGGYDGLYGPLLARSSPVQIPGAWRIDNIRMGGGGGGRVQAALKS